MIDHRGDVDYPAIALAHEMFACDSAEVESACQVDSDDAFPVIIGHPNDEVITSYARIVNEDMCASKLANYSLECFIDLRRH